MVKCCDPKFAPSQFRHQLVVENPTRVKDSIGQETITWNTFATVRGAIETKFKREINFGQKIESRAEFIIRTRYFPGLLTEMRIAFGSRIFQIQAIRNIEERNRFYEILCEEFVAT